MKGALEELEVTVFTGRDPDTGEHIMAVSGPIHYAGGELAGALRYVTSLKAADRQILLLVGGAVLLAAMVILMIWFTGMYFLHSIVTPVVEITDTAQRIAAAARRSDPEEVRGER